MPGNAATWKLEDGLLRIHGLQRDEWRLGVDVGTDADEAVAHDAGERRAHYGAIEPGLEQIIGGIGRARFRLGLFQVRGRRRVLRQELLGPLQRLLRELPFGFRAGDLRLELGIVHFEERSPCCDLLPFAHEDVRDPPLDLRLQLDGLDRLDLSRGLHRVYDGVVDGDRHLDGHGRHAATAPGSTGRRRFRLVAGGEQYDQHNR